MFETRPDSRFFLVVVHDPIDHFDKGASAAFAYIVTIGGRTTADARRFRLEGRSTHWGFSGESREILILAELAIRYFSWKIARYTPREYLPFGKKSIQVEAGSL